MELTKEQAAIVAAKTEPGGMLKVKAFAGTGKTSTFVAYSKANPLESMLYLAFNKSVDNAASGIFPSNVLTKTVHALAWGSKGRSYSRIVSGVRHFHVMKKWRLNVYMSTLVCQTLENWLNSADEVIEKKHVALDFKKKFKEDLSDHFIKTAWALWLEIVKGAEPFPMTHSGYLKLYQLAKPVLRQSVIMLDEAQDTNPVTFDIVQRQREHGAKVMLCGDAYQQIYSWRGAVDAMSFEECQTLFLTQSFRFGTHIASVANQILSTFFHERVPLIGSGQGGAIVSAFPAGEKYTVICRTNLELFNRAVDTATSGLSIHVIGEAAFNKFLEGIMDVYYLAIHQNSLINDRSIAYHHSLDHLKEDATDRDDRELLSKIAIVEKFKGQVPAHVGSIKKMNMPEDFAQVTLVTTHKAKGLEWDNVAIADDFTDLFDENKNLVKIKQQVAASKAYPVGPTGDAIRKLHMAAAVERDEIHLLYVAATRARRFLKLNNDLRFLMCRTPSAPKPAEQRPPASVASILGKEIIEGLEQEEQFIKKTDDFIERSGRPRLRNLFDNSAREDYEDTEN